MPTIEEDEPKDIHSMTITDQREQKNLTDIKNTDEHCTGRTRTASVAPGGVDGPGGGAMKNTDVQGRWRSTGSAGVATGGVDSVGGTCRSGNKTNQTDVKGPWRSTGRAGVATGGVGSAGGGGQR